MKRRGKRQCEFNAEGTMGSLESDTRSCEVLARNHSIFHKRSCQHRNALMIWDIVQQCIADVEGGCRHIPSVFITERDISKARECLHRIATAKINQCCNGWVSHSLNQKKSRSRRSRTYGG
ncbi:hypothetical protein FA13DRAFT_207735 [Coprinellus micaceus]|uniref:Uncharacterized protein n=1 Tax=Coprinellus micaceus TaxID=71717 RepID=A0A4Y7SG33_COPMI|nr:hypothetical protein FA13DRAFT_207735 [Coprinellus micaceus]